MEGELVWLIVSTSVGPKSLPPRRRGAFALQHGDFLLQQLVGHGDLANLGLQARDLLIMFVAAQALPARVPAPSWPPRPPPGRAHATRSGAPR